MANNLFSLFDDRLKQQRDLIAVPPKSLESISSKEEEQEFVLRKISQFELVKPKVDYSDFSNFVFFNSALDYFNVTGEKILNEYPYDGTLDSTQAYIDDLDDYQQHMVDIWPKNSGHLRFNPAVSASYVLVEDVGSIEGVTRASILSPGTGSWSIEMWCIPPPALTGSNDVMVALQKISGSGDGYSTYFSGSRVYLRLVSGSATEEISAPAVPGRASYFCGIIDRSAATPVLTLMTGSTSEFPVVASTANSFISGNLVFGSSKMSIASGTLSSKVTRPFTGSMDGVRLWQIPLSLADVSSSFNAKVFAQKNLVVAYRFNEKGSTRPTGSNPDPENAIVLDHSGHRMNGRIQRYFTAVRGSGSITPFEQPDNILFLNSVEVQELIATQQASGSAYDRDNDNLITRLLPDQYFTLEDFKNTDVLQKFLYILGRNFDYTKVRIDQFTKVLRTNYGQFDQAPDALLQDVARFFGWEFTGNFLNADAFQYIVGKSVLGGPERNKELDTKLYQVKNEFWKRTLINLMYLYKTKGTRESVESMLRIYGVNRNFVRLKEYGYKPNVGISTHRIAAEKSAAALTFGSGSTTVSSRVFSQPFTSIAKTIEARVKFPTTGTIEMPATVLTGSIWTLNSGSSMAYRLFWTKSQVGTTTGSLILTGSEGQVALTGATIFDNRWYNIAALRDPVSGTFSIEVRSLFEGEVDRHLSSSLAVSSIPTGSKTFVLWLGATGSVGAQQWEQEIRVWNQVLDYTELDDHTLNYQSFGTTEADGNMDLSLHWRLFENVSSSLTGELNGQILDISGRNTNGSGSGFLTGTNPYRKFLNDYNYIASTDFGWNEDKIRVLASTRVKPRDAFTDNSTLALEFNMVDALNEDISQVIATMDNFNNFIGLPVNRYRATYQDLAMLRRNYFKRLQGRLNFRVFADMLEFFDRSFVEMVRRLIPARANFLGEEFVVESHMLERPKLQWNYRRQEAPFQPLGVIKVFIRT